MFEPVISLVPSLSSALPVIWMVRAPEVVLKQVAAALSRAAAGARLYEARRLADAGWS